MEPSKDIRYSMPEQHDKNQVKKVTVTLTAAQWQDLLAGRADTGTLAAIDHAIRDQAGHVPNYRNYV